MGKNLLAFAGDARCRLDPWVREDSLDQEMATYSSTLCLENSMNRAWQARVHGVTKSWTWVRTQHRILTLEETLYKVQHDDTEEKDEEERSFREGLLSRALLIHNLTMNQRGNIWVESEAYRIHKNSGFFGWLDHLISTENQVGGEKLIIKIWSFLQCKWLISYSIFHFNNCYSIF